MAGEHDTLRELRSPAPLWATIRVLTFAFMALIIVRVGIDGAALLTGEAPGARSVVLAAGVALVDVAAFGFALSLIVLVCRFLHRAMRNLHVLDAPLTLIAPAWAAGWFFVPVANFWMPFLAVRQLQRGTDLLGRGRLAETDSTGAWWATWILGLVASLAGLHFELAAIGPGGAPALGQTALALWIGGGLIEFACCLFFLDVFGRLSRAQAALLNAAAR